MSSSSPKLSSNDPRRRWIRLSLGALGVVYGDIGTSPLYAFRECFHPEHGARPEPAAILGVLSLVFWSLVLLVSVKYLALALRADNDGKGGVLALLALLTRRGGEAGGTIGSASATGAVVFLGVLGTALLWADGVLTPAISVLGAVEGLEVAIPALRPLVTPIAMAILAALFAIQRGGTGRIGAVFGPVMLAWFATLAALGLPWIVREPSVLVALSPVHAARFLAEHGTRALPILGSVFLCVTGAEAVYADMGHFGRRPIRLAWHAVVFPALLLNYFGQGALLLSLGGSFPPNPFYALAPASLVLPLVGIASLAAIIASQALISGCFSLAQQAVLLGYLPRMRIVHTSAETEGQVYVPLVNGVLMAACLGVVAAFGRSSSLAGAYGLAVVGTMTITTVLLYAVARRRWGWGLPRAAAAIGLFLAVDLVFLLANGTKLVHGGWFPLVVGGIAFLVMDAWWRGRERVRRSIDVPRVEVGPFVEDVGRTGTARVPGTGVFLASQADGIPRVLLHHFKHNKALPERVVLFTFVGSGLPFVGEGERCAVRDLGGGFFRVVARNGYMETPHVPRTLLACAQQGLEIDPAAVTYYLGRETLLVERVRWRPHWHRRLFALLARNALPATAFFGLPPNRVVELGMQVVL